MSAWQALQRAAAADVAAHALATAAPRAAQMALLQRILRDARSSERGRELGFDAIDDLAAFRARVPLGDYEAVAPAIARMAAGERGVLTDAPLVAFEETSASTGARKLIPYTAESIAGFRRALLPWLVDLLEARPRIAHGRAYFVLSPPERAPRRTAGGTPIGLPDAAYFGPELAATVQSLLVIPDLDAGPRPEPWLARTLRALLLAEDLSLISVWSPTTLLALMATLGADPERALGELEAATPGLAAPRRRVLRAALGGGRIDAVALWPALDTISCWTDASAAPYVAQLAAAFPQARLQGKGLLCSEAVVSVPSTACGGPVPALGSAFLEFVDAAGRAWLCDELVAGRDYAVVVTTAGGLYRYRTGDRVRVDGHAGALPLLGFVGRDGLVADLCGEKLTESFVLDCLPRARGFMLLAPERAPRPHYVLLLDTVEHAPAEGQALAAALDAALHSNPQYALARRMDQLQAVEPRRVERASVRYLAALAHDGVRLGVAKPPALRRELGWIERLEVANP